MKPHSVSYLQPRFTLLASDPLAPLLLCLLSSLRMGRQQDAAVTFEALVERAAPYEVEPDIDGSSEASACSFSMVSWQRENEQVVQHG